MTSMEKYKTLSNQMEEIHKIWDERGNVTDCSAEPEFDKYESIIYLMAEFYVQFPEIHDMVDLVTSGAAKAG